MFIEGSMLIHFDPERYIEIETDALRYIIGKIFSQLTWDHLGQWYLVAFFFKMMIPAEIWYKTHDGEQLAIVEAFKTWKYYPKSYKHEVLVFANHNNLQRLMNTKNLSSKQVWWAQKLSKYHFWIDYWQSKANGAVDALSWYLQ